MKVTIDGAVKRAIAPFPRSRRRSRGEAAASPPSPDRVGVAVAKQQHRPYADRLIMRSILEFPHTAIRKAITRRRATCIRCPIAKRARSAIADVVIYYLHHTTPQTLFPSDRGLPRSAFPMSPRRYSHYWWRREFDRCEEPLFRVGLCRVENASNPHDCVKEIPNSELRTPNSRCGDIEVEMVLAAVA